MEPDKRTHEESWHNTKGLSVTIILLLLGNIVSTVWWAATLTGDVRNVQSIPKELVLIKERVIKLEAVTAEYKTVLSRLITVMDKMDSTINRIDREQAKRGPIVYKRRK